METNITLNHMVAEEVMKWFYNENDDTFSHHFKSTERFEIPSFLFQPSSNMNDAWKVLEQFPEGFVKKNSDTKGYEAVLVHNGKVYSYEDKTPMMAVCLASLKAVGIYEFYKEITI